MSFAWLARFPALVWILIIGVFFSRGTFLMVWPFLAILLYQKFQLNEWQIGLILSSSAVIAIFVGFYSGTLSDRFGRKAMLMTAGVLSVTAFAALAQASELWTYIVCIMLCALSKEIWDPAAKALISDLIEQSELREFALQVRYFAINVGAALGPLAGVWLGLTAQQSTFNATALVFILLTAAVFIGFSKQSPSQRKAKKTPFSFIQTFNLMARDQVLLLLVLANILVLYIYAHMDTSLVQYLTQAGVPQLVELVSAVILTNALTIISFQFVLLKLLGKYSLNQRVVFGMFLLAIGQLMMALNPVDLYWGWIAAVFLMSLGEAILFPTMNIQVDRLAPAHMKGAYFGAASLFSIGFAIAPYFGGVILSAASGPVLFLSNVLLCGVVLVLYYLIRYAKRPAMVLNS